MPQKKHAKEFHVNIAKKWLKCAADGLPASQFWWLPYIRTLEKQVRCAGPRDDNERWKALLRKLDLLSKVRSRSELLTRAKFFDAELAPPKNAAEEEPSSKHAVAEPEATEDAQLDAQTAPAIPTAKKGAVSQ